MSHFLQLRLDNESHWNSIQQKFVSRRHRLASAKRNSVSVESFHDCVEMSAENIITKEFVEENIETKGKERENMQKNRAVHRNSEIFDNSSLTKCERE